MSERVGFFGGTFDPIHNGHLRLADNAFAECELDRIVFIPAAMPPHKPQKEITSFSHRVEMLKAALEGRPQYDYSLIENELPAPSYTIDTMRMLIRSYSDDTEFFFLTGLDAFLEITTWKEYEELLKMVRFIVSERKGEEHSLHKETLAEKIGYSRNGDIWTGTHGRLPVFFLKGLSLALSSSMIRSRLENKQSIRGMVPESVCGYILKNQLYICKT